MKKILHIISSPRGEASVSIKLGNAIVEKIIAAYPGSTVKVNNLVETQFPHLAQSHLASFFTPPAERTSDQLLAVAPSETAIADIMEADFIVIGAPLYNFNIHSSLKAYIDHIVRSGITFKYDENGPAGLVMNKQVYIASSSGWVYSEGEMQAMDFATPYLKTILNFIGMTNLHIVRAEGTAVPGIQDTALEKAINSIQVN